MRALTVTHAFGPHAIGASITDPSEIDAVLAGSNAPHVVQVNLPDPEPETDEAAEKPASGKGEKSSAKA